MAALKAESTEARTVFMHTCVSSFSCQATLRHTGSTPNLSFLNRGRSVFGVSPENPFKNRFTAKKQLIGQLRPPEIWGDYKYARSLSGTSSPVRSFSYAYTYYFPCVEAWADRPLSYSLTRLRRLQASLESSARQFTGHSTSVSPKTIYPV